MGSGFLAFDFTGRTVSSNPAAQSILGLTESEILDRPGAEVLQLPELEPLLQSGLSLPFPPRHFEWNYRRGDGAAVPLSMNLSNITDDDGTPTGVIGVFQDVTRLKEMEKRIAHSDRLAAIGQMSAGIAHEIRNPLASMSGSIQMLSKGLGPVLEDSQKRLMEIILRETDRLNTIITRFLQFAGPSSTQKEERPLHLLIREVVSLLEHGSDNAFSVRFRYDPDSVLTASVDPEQFKQLLWNLCMNSIQAMPRGGELRIATRLVSGDGAPPWKKNGRDVPWGGEFVQLSVSDDGEGIPDECLKKIYDPFFTTKPKGTGLGLSTVYKIVENHGGHIDVDSSPGKGTTFTVFLPVR
jgi:two-component system sensor histidine kinase PilS (NtrC family)